MDRENEKKRESQAAPDWELRREPEVELPPPAPEREDPAAARKRRLNTLQKYLILFFIVALALVIVAGVFQQKLRGSSESYEAIIAEKENTILTNSGMLGDLQRRYDALVKERDAQNALIDSLQKESDANRAEADSLRVQTEAERTLFAAQSDYNRGRYSACREKLAGINPDALSAEAKVIYENLQRRVG